MFYQSAPKYKIYACDCNSWKFFFVADLYYTIGLFIIIRYSAITMYMVYCTHTHVHAG